MHFNSRDGKELIKLVITSPNGKKFEGSTVSANGTL